MAHGPGGGSEQQPVVPADDPRGRDPSGLQAQMSPVASDNAAAPEPRAVVPGGVGAVSEREVHDQVAARLRLDAGRVEAFMADLWAEYLGTPNGELIAYVRSLRSRCRLGILSNSFVGARERETAAYRFDELVEEIVYSHEIGICKPDERAFRMTCARLDVRPEDCLFIDDAAANVAAAQKVGMRAHVFRDNAAAVARIAAHLNGAAPSR
ncbi:HAD family hydrolase [Streptomyces alkaliterrae]|uniref:HAD family hydrolase n=1 Tax=Streptomyces alkaliterrae TaxID=2213162 RepID=UPI003F68C7CA